MPAVATRPGPAPAPLVSQRVAKLQPDGSAIKCLFSDDTFLTVSRLLAGFIHLSDQIEFDPTAVEPNRELHVVQNTSRRPRELYAVPIGYVTVPKPDKRNEYFVRAAVTDSRLGVKHVHLPNEAVRDYFYFGNRRRPGCEEQTLYDLLRTVPSAAPVTAKPFSQRRSCRSSRTVGSGGSGHLFGRSSSSMTMQFIVTAGERRK